MNSKGGRRGRGRGGRGGFAPPFSSRSHAGLLESHIDVPEDQMGLVIGKGGRTIQQISTDTGARVFTKREIRHRVFIKAETEEAIERAKQAVSRIVSSGKRRSAASERRTLAIDPGKLGDDGQLCLKRMRIPGQDSKYFRLVPAPTEGALQGLERGMGSEHITDVLRVAEEVLRNIRRDADERPEGSPMEVDVWVHLGHLMLRNVDDREAAVPLSVSTVLSKTNKGKYSWHSFFEAGVVGLDIDWLHQLLADNADKIQSSVRHDIGFYTPSGQNRRFKVWIPEAGGTEDTGVQHLDVFTGNEDSRGIGSAVVKAGPGILCTAFAPRLKADVALPSHRFDCRLLVKTGVREPPMQRANEKLEDAVLTQEFCEKVRISGTDLHLPPHSGLPDGYRLHYKRKSERRSYSFSGFELTTSRETSIQYDKVDHPEEQCKVDLHIHSMECDALLDQNGGRDWRPEDIVQVLPKMLKFVKEDLNLLE